MCPFRVRHAFLHAWGGREDIAAGLTGTPRPDTARIRNRGPSSPPGGDARRHDAGRALLCVRRAYPRGACAAAHRPAGRRAAAGACRGRQSRARPVPPPGRSGLDADKLWRRPVRACAPTPLSLSKRSRACAAARARSRRRACAARTGTAGPATTAMWWRTGCPSHQVRQASLIAVSAFPA